MRTTLIFLVAFLELCFAATTDYCYECATAALKTKWYTTGLPNHPADLPFKDQCLSLGTTFPQTTSCPGAKCFELSFPLDGAQQIVRGCWRNFIQGYDAFASIADRCEYTIGSGNNGTPISLGSSEKTTTTPVTVFRTCTLNPTLDPCNFYFGLTQGGTAPGALYGNKSDVEEACSKGGVSTMEAIAGKECYSCSRFGKDGTCHRKSKKTCRSGTYCMKLEGKIGKNDVVLRDCAPINPYTDAAGQPQDVCFGIDETFGLSTMFGNGPQYRFDKNTRMCICKNDRCNPARTQSPLLAGLFALLASIPFLL